MSDAAPKPCRINGCSKTKRRCDEHCQVKGCPTMAGRCPLHARRADLDAIARAPRRFTRAELSTAEALYKAAREGRSS